MAVPKGKISKARKHSRRANWKISAPGIVACPRCQPPENAAAEPETSDKSDAEHGGI